MITIPREEVERLVRTYGLPGESERLRELAGSDVSDPLVRVWGAVGVDGAPPEATLEGLLRWERLVSSPALAAGMAVANWATFRMSEGVLDAAVRAGREVLAREQNELAKRADQPLVDNLGRKIQTQAARFLEGLTWPEVPREPRGWGEREVLPWCEATALAVWRRARPDLRRAEVRAGEELDAAREAWLREREEEEPASLVDGVPWLSWQLARFLRDELGAPEQAEKWLKRERERTAELAHPELQMGQGPACVLPGWLHNVAKHLSSPGPGVSSAMFTLAAAVWRVDVLPELEKAPYPTSMLLFEAAKNNPWTGLDPSSTSAWSVSEVDLALVMQAHKEGALDTVAAEALWRKLPDLARIASNNGGRRTVVWRGPEGEVTVNLTTQNRTEVEVDGGYAALSAYLGQNAGEDRKTIRAALMALAKMKLTWWGAGGDEGCTALVLDLHVHPSRGVSFALSKVLWPGFSTYLRKADKAQEERRRVPVAPDLPPTTSRKLGTKPSQLELAAMAWIRDHLDQIEGGIGAPVPWEKLAEEVKLSSASQATRRASTLEGLLKAWEKEGRWHRDGSLWRPAYGWSGKGSLLEALEMRVDGKAINAGTRPTKRGV